MAQMESGAWYVWGYNLYGQLGIGSDGYNSAAFTPVKMSGF
jgi:alpha-tubulin suppressor-like RCC1 family protein